MARDLQLLKEVLSVPTHTYQEDLMVQFIVDWLKSKVMISVEFLLVLNF